MARLHLFADESGNFDFRNHQWASEYFILTSVTFFNDFESCQALNRLRHQLAWEGVRHPGEFHATTDRQAIRDRVFEILRPHRFRIDATLLHKRKARPELRQTPVRFYQYAWYYHLKHIAPLICRPGDEILVVAASLGNRKERDSFHTGVEDVVRQTLPNYTPRTTHWPAATETGLQIADYCGWAIQKKWESADTRSYDLIKDRVRSEYDLFKMGTRTYY